MGDPNLYSDEQILIRTPGIFINSIPFEGILTNKRIILTDETAILLPRREIPLDKLRNTRADEDGIGDKILRLTVQAEDGEIRELIITFSDQIPGTRAEERDEWLGILKEKVPSSNPEQKIHNVIQEQVKDPQRVEDLKPLTPKYVPVIVRTTVKKETTWTTSTEWFNGSPPPSPSGSPSRIYDDPISGSGMNPPPEKVFNHLLFGVMFLIFIIICSMMMSITSTLYAQDSPLGITTTNRISASTPLTVSLPPPPQVTASISKPVPVIVPPGNSANALPDTPLAVPILGSSPVSGTPSSYVTVEPKATPDIERRAFLQQSIVEKYGDGYVTIYSLADQNISQVLPYVSFSLHNPPLVIDYNVTPLSQLRLKHVEYKMMDTYYEDDVEINRPYEDSWFKIIVRNKDTGEVISEDGFGRTYSFQTPKQLVLRENGNYSFEFTGNYGVLDLVMKVKKEGNLP